MNGRHKSYPPLFSCLEGMRYGRVLEAIKAAHALLWQHRRHPHFTLHDAAHAESIIRKLHTWLDGVFHLDPQDTFTLQGAIYLHDIGMQCPPSDVLESVLGETGPAPYGYEQLEQIRSAHHKLSRKMVEALIDPYVCAWGHVDTTGVEREVLAIALLCEGHAASNLEGIQPKITTEYVNLPRQTNLSRLLYLLRLGDAMDAEASRVNDDYVKGEWRALEAKDRFHTWKHWFVSNIVIDGAGLIKYNYVIPKTYLELRHDIETCAEAPVQDGLREMGLQLRQWSVWPPEVHRRVCEIDNDVHEACPLESQGCDFFREEAERIRQRRDQQSLRGGGTFQAYAPILPKEHVNPSLLDDAKKAYIPLKASLSSDNENDGLDLISAASESLASGKVPLILGTYGTGKSFFIRRFLHEIVHRRPGKDERLAVLIPLRELHFARVVQQDVLATVLHVLDEKGHRPFDHDDLRQSARKGQLLFLLDGLDEIPYAYSPGAADECLASCLELATYGQPPNGILVTCRTGLLRNISRRDCMPLHIQKWDSNDFAAYVRQCKEILGDTNAENLIGRVLSNANLADLATRPLYARMLVEVGQDIQTLGDAELNEFELVDRFVRGTFNRKKHLSVYNNLEAKMECMTVIAGHLLRSGLPYGTVEDLRATADRMLGQDWAQIRKFFEAEISVYSLMQPAGHGRVTFSHDTIRDYFFVRYMRQLWAIGGASLVEDSLGSQVLSSCAVRLFVQQFLGREQELRRFATNQLARAQDEHTKANCALVLAHLHESVFSVEGAFFEGADMSSTIWKNTKFRHCRFRSATFRFAMFQACSFENCVLYSVDVTGATFINCDFAGSELGSFWRDDRSSPPRFSSSSFRRTTLDDESENLIRSCLDLEARGKAQNTDAIRATLKSLQND